MAVTVLSESGYAQVIHAGHHRLTADEPPPNGTDTGPAPYGLLLASLGACTSITLRMYAERKGWQLGQIHVALGVEHAADGTKIHRELRFSAPLTDEQKTKLADIAEKTPVTKTLRAGATITTKLV
jgi:putative redox protein